MDSYIGTTRSSTGLGMLFVALLLLGRAAPVSAAESEPSDPRWQGWLGCWIQAGDGNVDQADGTGERLVCIVPAAGASAVDVVTLAEGAVVNRQRIDATGERQPIAREGCTGWESAEWSSLGTRIYLHSEFECDGGLRRSASGIMSMTSSTEWSDVHSVRVGQNKVVRAVQYREAAIPSPLPDDIREALGDRMFSVSAARIAAATSLTVTDVIDAARHVDASTVEEWLIDRRDGFALDARRLVQLSTAGVPDGVIDLMVALSYPSVYAIHLPSRSAGYEPLDPGRGVAVADPYPLHEDPFFRERYRRDRYGYRYGYSPYGYDPYGWYRDQRPVIIVVAPGDGAGDPGPRGTVVKGKGYTRGGSGSTRGTPATRSTTGSGSSAAAPASSGASSGVSGSSGSGEKAPPARTAKPRKTGGGGGGSN